MLDTAHRQHNRCNHTHRQQGCATPTLAANEFAALATKISKAHLRHMYSDATLTLWRTGGGDAGVAMDIHTAQFAGMNLLGMMSARSRRRPRVKATVRTADAHAPFGINQSDIAPANCDLLNRIDNADSLLRVDNFGTDEDQIDQYVGGTTPCDCCAQSASQKRRPDQQYREHKGASAQNEPTLWPKGFRATHTSIFSYAVSCTDGQVA